jgi:phosphonate utilization transcriptional regulator
MPAAPTTLAVLRSASLVSAVQEEIERLILSGELAPGEKLGEVALAARLGVSRGPLREAFRMLEEAGLVRTEKNRGVFVREVPLAEVLEIFDVRATMESWAARRLAEIAEAGVAKELRMLCDGMERAVRDGDTDGYHRMNLAFHDRLVEMAGNAKLLATYRRLTKELALSRRLNLGAGGGLPASAGEHRQIVRTIAAGDGAAAAAALHEHVMQSKRRTAERATKDRP